MDEYEKRKARKKTGKENGNNKWYGNILIIILYITLT